MHARKLLPLLLIAGSALAAAPSASAQAPLPGAAPAGTPVPHELIVAFKRSAPAGRRAAAIDRVDARTIGRLRTRPTRLLRLPRGRSVAAAAERLERSPAVAFAEPNRVIRAFAPSNDPFFSEQYSLHNFGQQIGLNVTGTADADMDVPEAWDITTGSNDVIVAVPDSGLAYDSPEFASNLFVNPGESGGGRETNGLDDDGNGLVDDFRGWDFVGGDNDVRDLGLFPHGTVSASVIGARGNDGFGVAGVTQRVRILPIRVLDVNGNGNTFRATQAFDYARTMGARIVNASFGGSGFSQAQSDSIGNAPNTLFVAAAGNDGTNNDSVGSPVHPCNDTHANMLCVAATDEKDQLAGFSNFGATSVDLAAPGVGVVAAAPSYGVEFADDFETDIAGRWLSGGTNNTWARTTAASTSPTNSLTDSPGGNYANNTDSFIRTVNPVDLTGNVGCRVDFQMRLTSEGGPANFIDGLVVEAATNTAGPWTELRRFAGSTGTSFIPVDADLTSLQGQATVFLRFRFVSDASVVFDGAYVDDFVIQCLSSAYSGDELIYANGTSFSAPNVSGIGALALSLAPDLSAAQLKDALMQGVDANPASVGKTVTAGRANALGTLRRIRPGVLTGDAAAGRTVAALRGVVGARGQPTRFFFEYGPTAAYGSRTPELDAGDAAAARSVSVQVDGLRARTTYHYRLVATSGAGTTEGADRTLVTTGAADERAPAALKPVVKVDRKRRATLRFSVSEAVLFAGFVTGRAGEPKRIPGQSLAAGKRRLKLGRLRVGRYTAAFTLRDQAGNRSKPKTIQFRVRKGKGKSGKKPRTSAAAAKAAAGPASPPDWTQPIGAGGGAPGYKPPGTPAATQYDSPSHQPAVQCGPGGCVPISVSTCAGSPCLDRSGGAPTGFPLNVPMTESRKRELENAARNLEDARDRKNGSSTNASAGATAVATRHPVVAVVVSAVSIFDRYNANDLTERLKYLNRELTDRKVVPDGTPGAVPPGADILQLPDLGRPTLEPGGICGYACAKTGKLPGPPRLVPSPYTAPNKNPYFPKTPLLAPARSNGPRGAVDALGANIAAVVRLQKAFRKAVAAAEAARGDRARLDRAVLEMQIDAARIVSLLRQQAGLRKRVVKALRGSRFKVTFARAKAIQKQVAAKGLPATLAKVYRRNGVDPGAVAKAIAAAKPEDLTGDFPAAVDSRAVRKTAAETAQYYAAVANAP
jgi:hypothetical protein